MGRSIESLFVGPVDFQTAGPIFLSTVIKTAKDSVGIPQPKRRHGYLLAVGFTSDPVFTNFLFSDLRPRIDKDTYVPVLLPVTYGVQYLPKNIISTQMNSATEADF
jgi:hypothetical protein